MSRNRARSQPVVRGFTQYVGAASWHVNLGKPTPFVIDPKEAPPPNLADLYSATAVGDPPDFRITITDRATGATVAIADGRVTMTDAPDDDIDRLRRDAKIILGLAVDQTGRPSEQAARLASYRAAILALREAGYEETRILQRHLLKRIDRTGNESQLRDDLKDSGGWAKFRAAVYRGE